MPETQAKKLPKTISNPTPNHNPRLPVTEQPTDFTTQQQVRLQAGDLQMTRLQIGLYNLRYQMSESSKQMEQLLKQAQMDIK